jgi:hypothetical protein
LDQIRNPVVANPEEIDQTKEELNYSLNNSNKIISSDEAFLLCSKLMSWLEAQQNAKSDDLLFLQRIKELASANRVNDLSHLNESGLINAAESLSLSFLSEKLNENK